MLNNNNNNNKEMTKRNSDTYSLFKKMTEKNEIE